MKPRLVWVCRACGEIRLEDNGHDMHWDCALFPGARSQFVPAAVIPLDYDE